VSRDGILPLDDVFKRPVVQVSLGVHVEGAANPHACPRHAVSLECSFKKRVAAKTPRANRKLRLRFRKFVRRYVRQNFPQLEPDTDLSLETWLAATKYPESRKNQLRAAAAKVCNDPTWNNKYWAMVDAFGKDECYPAYKYERGIYARRDEFKTIVGPLFHAMEELVYKHPGFIKHVPVLDRAAYVRDRLQLPGACYMATDYTAFESHFDAQMMEECEFQLYRWMIGDSVEMRRILDYYERTVCAVNHIQFRRILKASMPAGRMSGEMTTSLGNGFTNLMIYLFMLKELGLSEHDNPCVVEGDDCLARLLTFDYGVVQRFYTDMGMNVKIECHSDLGLASFCGLVFDVENLVVVPDPIKVILNTGWCAARYKDSSDRVLRELLRGKAMSVMCNAIGCPILQSYAQYLLRVTSGSRYRIDDYWLRARVAAVWDSLISREIEPESRAIMEKKYGVSMQDQIYLENTFDALDSLEPFDDEIFRKYCHPDTLHYFYHYVRADEGEVVAFALPDQKVNS